jgi:hypothetical protein
VALPKTSTSKSCLNNLQYDKLQNKAFFDEKGNQHQIMTSQENNWVVVWLGIAM